MNENVSKNIMTQCQASRKVLLVCHPNPDADSLGSACAFKHYLQSLNVPATLFCVTSAPKGLLFLPHANELQTNPIIFNDATIDTVITFDAGDLRYLEIVDLLPRIPGNPKVINIDHHASNEHYGDINMVQIDAASTTEVLYRFFQEVGFDLDADVATCLFAGIINDTDHFSNAATTASAMSVASDLITHGARINAVRAGMLQNKSVSLLKLWGIALARLYFQPTQEAVVTYLFQKDYESYGLTDGEVHGIPNFLNNLGEGRYTLFLKETENGSIKGSLRTTRDDIDVATIAKNFGGGGHKKAAGFTIPGRLVETPQGVRVVSQQQINTATQQHLR